MESPNKGIVLAAEDVPTIDRLSELLDVMIVRRERIGRSSPDVGVEIARQNYDDTVLVVDAIKAVFAGLRPSE